MLEALAEVAPKGNDVAVEAVHSYLEHAIGQIELCISMTTLGDLDAGYQVESIPAEEAMETLCKLSDGKFNGPLRAVFSTYLKHENEDARSAMKQFVKGKAIKVLAVFAEQSDPQSDQALLDLLLQCLDDLPYNGSRGYYSSALKVISCLSTKCDERVISALSKSCPAQRSATDALCQALIRLAGHGRAAEIMATLIQTCEKSVRNCVMDTLQALQNETKIELPSVVTEALARRAAERQGDSEWDIQDLQYRQRH